MNAYVRVVVGDGAAPVRHDVTVVDTPAASGEPLICEVPGFGLYAVGVHPELGPLATYLVPTPGVDPEPASCERVDGRLEVRLLEDRITLVVEDYPS